MFEILNKLKSDSKLLILDFNEIPENTEPNSNIKLFFENCKKQNIDPKTPQNRQKFNNNMLKATNSRYLIGRYGEDRIEMLKGSQIAKEKRTIHLGIDIFAQSQETIYAPLDGKIVKTGKEPESHSFGYYLITEHTINNETIYCFFGHLSKDLPKVGTLIKAGDPIAKMGNQNENGSWSIHLHFQLFKNLPKESPLGYLTKKDFEKQKHLYPDPRIILGNIY